MNPFMLPTKELLDEWAEVRESLKEIPELDQLVRVVGFWSMCPFSNWSLDPEKPKEWLTVWEMLYEGEYCKNAIALGMESTLRYSGWNPERFQLAMVKKRDDGDEFFVLIIDETHVLNYHYGDVTEVNTLQHETDTLYTYRWNGKSYSK